MDKSDEELIADYAAGHTTAFTELVGRHLSGVYSYVLRLVGGTQEAEDIAQETFLKAWKALGSYNPKTSKFKTWLLRIARNASIDFLRKKKHVPFSEFESDGVNVLVETVADNAESAEELFAKEQDSDELRTALGRISPAHRDILLLYYTNDVTFDELGTMLNESPNTIKSRHRRALQALSKALKGPGAGTKNH